VREELVLLVEDILGHAIDAAEIAAVSHRDAQVVQRTSQAVAQPAGRLDRDRRQQAGRNSSRGLPDIDDGDDACSYDLAIKGV
jgi:hypothetical protein